MEAVKAAIVELRRGYVAIGIRIPGQGTLWFDRDGARHTVDRLTAVLGDENPKAARREFQPDAISFDPLPPPPGMRWELVDDV